MFSGDRVMVFESTGTPLDHFLYANVLTPNDHGALVVVDHPGNAAHNVQRFVNSDKILTSADAIRLSEDYRQKAKAASSADDRRLLMDLARHFDFIASQLS